MPKVDLHTHSAASPDGGITSAQYKKLLDTGTLDYVAITDHNQTDFAISLHQELGDKIIVGEEILTAEGEIIGLFLTDTVEPGLSAIETIQCIKAQGGLVYIPHPFETVRKGMSQELLDHIAKEVNIIEVCNGRALFQNRGAQALTWSKMHLVAAAASSDAHGIGGIGRTYSVISEPPTAKNLVSQLQNARLNTRMARPLSLLYPKYNRLRHKMRIQS